jgi:hypothetical protein
MDAQLIFDKYLGRNDLPSGCSGNSRTSLTISSYREGLITVNHRVDNFNKDLGGDIFFSIIVGPNSNIKSFGFDLQFPAHKIGPIGLEKTEITKGFSQVGFHEISPGLLRVGGYKANGKQGYSSGVLLILVFRIIKPPIKANEIRIAATYDDLRSDSIRTEPVQRKIKENRQPKKNPLSSRL